MLFLLASGSASLKKSYGLCRQPIRIHAVGIRVGGFKSACSGRRHNRAENSIRPYVVGRKSWLFSDQPSGAHASAVIYSLVETARANDVEPYTWLCRVLRELPRAQNADDYEALLPWNLNPLKMTTEELKTLNS